MSDFTDSLQQASFRGIPFGVYAHEQRFGRRQAVHEYPNRDKPWAEDMGRSTRPFTITGFLVTDSLVYGGGDVIDQFKQMAAAAETKGPGTLIHPLLGTLQVSVLDGGLAIAGRWDEGRKLEFTLSCIESGEKQFPGDQANTPEDTDTAADDADDANEEDFSDDVADVLDEGASILDMATNTAQAWISTVLVGAADATSLFNMMVDLPGQFGRYFAGRTTGYASPSPAPVSNATITSLIVEGTAERGNVQANAATLLAACQKTDTGAMCAAARATAASLLACTANPADAVRILSGICNFFPAAFTSPSVTGMGEATMQTAMGAMLRRCTLAALARATALYQPSSSDDAMALSNSMADLFQSEIDIAGDYPDDNSFQALGDLRAAIIADLAVRGAALPALQTVTSNQPLPAPVIAQRLYLDASRTDELITEADPINPVFMPLSFKALVS